MIMFALGFEERIDDFVGSLKKSWGDCFLRCRRSVPRGLVGRRLLLWNHVIDPNFDLAKIYSLNRLPADEQRRVFDQLGPESGQALFELFVWMFDQTGATVVERGPAVDRASHSGFRSPPGAPACVWN